MRENRVQMLDCMRLSISPVENRIYCNQVSVPLMASQFVGLRLQHHNVIGICKGGVGGYISLTLSLGIFQRFKAYIKNIVRQVR